MKRVLDSLDGLSDEMKKAYQKTDGNKFELIIDGNDEIKTKLNDFRDKNIALLKDQEDSKKVQDALQTKFDDLTKEITTLKADKDKDKGAGDKATDQIALLAQQITDMKDLLVKKDERQVASDKRLAIEKIRGALTSAIQKVATVRKGALEDILRRGEGVFSLDDNLNPVAKKPDGSLMLNDKGDKIGYDDYAKSLIADAPFLFDGNKGGGSTGGEQGGGATAEIIPVESAAANVDKILSGDVVVQME